jgi:hypothetical protein
LQVIAELCDEETAEAVSHLQRHQVIAYDVETRKREMWGLPSLWYSDLSVDYFVSAA